MCINNFQSLQNLKFPWPSSSLVYANSEYINKYQHFWGTGCFIFSVQIKITDDICLCLSRLSLGRPNFRTFSELYIENYAALKRPWHNFTSSLGFCLKEVKKYVKVLSQIRLSSVGIWSSDILNMNQPIAFSLLCSRRRVAVQTHLGSKPLQLTLLRWEICVCVSLLRGDTRSALDFSLV